LSSAPGAGFLSDWQVLVQGYRLPLAEVSGSGGSSRLSGVRFRTFVPRFGLHPSVPALPRVDLTLTHLTRPEAWRISLFSWRPNGGAYPGLPEDAADAAQRRAERFVVERLTSAEIPAAKEPAKAALSPYCLDLRRAG
jgi:uncharacterized protein (DUF2126 family)